MIDGIFGFCDIREFTAATECLQEDVMMFVNKVGQIVSVLCRPLSPVFACLTSVARQR